MMPLTTSSQISFLSSPVQGHVQLPRLQLTNYDPMIAFEESCFSQFFFLLEDLYCPLQTDKIKTRCLSPPNKAYICEREKSHASLMTNIAMTCLHSYSSGQLFSVLRSDLETPRLLSPISFLLILQNAWTHHKCLSSINGPEIFQIISVLYVGYGKYKILQDT